MTISPVTSATRSESAEEMCFPYGVTTMVDCDGSGWRTFDDFNTNVIKKSAVRVFALLNIVGQGMEGDVEQNVEDMDAELTAAKIRHRLRSSPPRLKRSLPR